MIRFTRRTGFGALIATPAIARAPYWSSDSFRILSAIAAAAGLPLTGRADDDLVLSSRGDLPIILTAPHGGRVAVPGASERQPGGPYNANVDRDFNTDDLAIATSNALRRLLGAEPSIVVARFSRRWIDANRPPEAAFEAGTAAFAAPVYEAYHRAIAEAVERIRTRFGRGLLIDIHGQSAEPGVTFRGTSDGATVAGLVSRSGIGALIGPESLMGSIAAAGIVVSPVVGSREREDPRFSGGHTVRTYGRLPGRPIDAIQIEFGSVYRRAENIAVTVEALARAGSGQATRYGFVRNL